MTYAPGARSFTLINMASHDRVPRALELLWGEQPPARRKRPLSRDRIVAAAIEIADADGLGALSMTRIADRLGCGTMSLYRHVTSKDELLILMLSAAPDPPPPQDRDWRQALTDWANGLWDVYHRHPWILSAASAGPPADPGQLAWLEAGLSALRATPLTERDKVSAIISLLHYVRGAAALAIEMARPTGSHTGPAGGIDPLSYPDLLAKLLDRDRFPAIAAALVAGAFDRTPGDDPRTDFLTGVQRVLDGIDVLAQRSRRG
jgi:AcrR family transcriptional regulator